MRFSRFLSVAVLLLVCVGAARGGDFSDEPVGARITLAKERILIFTDAIARQASAAYPYSSATNPASDDFVRTPPADYKGYVLPITSDIFFDNGTTVAGVAGIASVRLPEAGSIKGAFVRLDSHDGRSRQGDEFILRSNEVLLSYSRQFGPKFAVGGKLRLTDATLVIRDTFAGSPRHTESNTNGVGFDAGMIVAASPRLTLGIHGGLKWDKTNTEGSISTGPPVLLGLKDTAQLSEVRAGLGWKASDQLSIYTDLQYVHMENDFGTTEVGRLSVGGEFFATPVLALRLGGVVDTLPQVGVAAGLGYYGIKGATVELAYAYNTFPEVRREFGRAHLISFSYVLLF